VADHLSRSFKRAQHWEALFVEGDPTLFSWFQEDPTLSLELFDLLHVDANAAVIDVGAGESFLVDRLLARGFKDLTVLDISPSAISASQRRVGDSSRVAWITQDLLTWQPERRYDVWHDRAVFHFLNTVEIESYLALLSRALAPDGALVLGTFAHDGPQRCSGLATNRYSAEGLATVLGVGFDVVAQRREVHHTPRGVAQPFMWIAARRRPG
jgi:SAM-dependent methyltransferase